MFANKVAPSCNLILTCLQPSATQTGSECCRYSLGCDAPTQESYFHDCKYVLDLMLKRGLERKYISTAILDGLLH